MIVEFEIKDVYGVQYGFIVADTKNISLNAAGGYLYALLNGKRYEIEQDVYNRLYKAIKGTERVKKIWNTKKDF